MRTLHKLLCLLLLTVAVCLSAPLFDSSQSAKAQITNEYRPITAKDSLVNTDTLYINLNPVDNAFTGFHVTATRSTGTTAGKVYLQGSVKGNEFKHIDSVTLNNTATVFATFGTSLAEQYSRLRAMFVTSGTVKLVTIRGYIVRRNGRR